MKEIELTQNKVALVDDEDYELLNQYKWFANLIGNVWYAARSYRKDGRKYSILMHRFIMNIDDGKVLIDHKDGNGLNNTKDNLRVCNNAQNAHNCGPQKNNKSGYKGVSWSNTYKKWEARMTVNKKNIFVGYFQDIEEAVRAIDSAILKHHREFAKPNNESIS